MYSSTQYLCLRLDSLRGQMSDTLQLWKAGQREGNRRERTLSLLRSLRSIEEETRRHNGCIGPLLRWTVMAIAPYTSFAVVMMFQETRSEEEKSIRLLFTAITTPLIGNIFGSLLVASTVYSTAKSLLPLLYSLQTHLKRVSESDDATIRVKRELLQVVKTLSAPSQSLSFMSREREPFTASTAVSSILSTLTLTLLFMSIRLEMNLD